MQRNERDEAMSDVMLPRTHEAIREMLVEAKANQARLESELKRTNQEIEALRCLCSHPETKRVNDTRGECLTCGTGGIWLGAENSK